MPSPNKRIEIVGTFKLVVEEGADSNMETNITVSDPAMKQNMEFFQDLNSSMLCLKREFACIIADHVFTSAEAEHPVVRLLTASMCRRFGPIADATSPAVDAFLKAWMTRKKLSKLLKKAEARVALEKVCLLQALMELPEIMQPMGELKAQAPKPTRRIPSHGDN